MCLGGGAGRFILSALALLLSACSAFQSDGQGASLSFKIPSELVSKLTSPARSVLPAEASNLFIEIALSGDHTVSATHPLIGTDTVTFSEIPVGAKIQAKASVYESDGNVVKTELYAGQSNQITIKEGENTLSLVLKSVPHTVTVVSGGATATYEENPYLAVTAAEGGFTFTATDGAEGYLWSVDGEAQDESGNAFTLETENLASGAYDVTLIMTVSGETLSFFVQVTK